MWRSLWSALDLVREGVAWRVGNGRRVNIWGDKWLSSMTYPKILSPTQLMSRDSKVCNLIDEEERVWNLDHLKEIFSAEEVELIRSI